MRVRCIKTSLNEAEKLGHGDKFRIQDYPVSVNCEYQVLGLTFLQDKTIWGTGVYYELNHDLCRIMRIPSECFEIIDDKVSRHWVSKEIEIGFYAVWPNEFFREYFHDDLFERRGEVLSEYKRVLELIASDDD